MKVAIYTRESGTRQYKPASARALYAPNTTFCLRYTDQGKRKWQQLSVSTYKEAHAASLQKLSELITDSCKETPTVSMQLQQNFNLPTPRPLQLPRSGHQLKPQSQPNELTLDAAIDRYT